MLTSELDSSHRLRRVEYFVHSLSNTKTPTQACLPARFARAPARRVGKDLRVLKMGFGVSVSAYE